jgi:alanyl-tRNA synthetase
MRKPAAGAIVHVGMVNKGNPKVGDDAIAIVDIQRRKDIMRNHTATHLLHAELRRVLGDHVHQSGSLVEPDRLRFDFTHPEAVTPGQLAEIEAGVNRHILGNFQLTTTIKSYQQAVSEGAMALFSEKYGETVRTITIGGEHPFSYELCGGTHVDDTGDIGICLITSEGSVAAGIRRIEAVTGRKAYELIKNRFNILNQVADLLESNPLVLPEKITSLLDELSVSRKQITALRQNQVFAEFDQKLLEVKLVGDVKVISAKLYEADADTLRQMTDRFRQRFPTRAVAVLGSVKDGRPTIIAAITEDLVKSGFNAIELVRLVAAPLGGGGGGKPILAQAGGKDAAQMDKALESVDAWVKDKLYANP